MNNSCTPLIHGNTVLPSSSQLSIAIPRFTDCISPLYTGSVGFCPAKQEIMSVPPEEWKKTTGDLRPFGKLCSLFIGLWHAYVTEIEYNWKDFCDLSAPKPSEQLIEVSYNLWKAVFIKDKCIKLAVVFPRYQLTFWGPILLRLNTMYLELVHVSSTV